MRTFDYSKLQNCTIDTEILGYIAKIHEFKGRQELYVHQKKDKLEKLVEIAKVQSTESSNKIEGIVTTENRIKQLVADKTAPRNRDEKEIMGYRDVLNVIHENFEYIPLTPNYILQLHKRLYLYAEPDSGGKFKNVQNYIVAGHPDGTFRTLFTPLSPFETPDAVQELCGTFNRAMDLGEIDPLLLIPNFIKDFLCIHPFNDGNGRMSRLLTTLLLYRSGFVVCKYISLEKKIERTKDSYYAVLEASSENWLEGRNDNTPFVKYLLGIFLSAYRDFEERLNLIDGKPSALDAVAHAISGRIGKFTKSDIQEECPSLARQTVEKALKELCDSGKIEKKGSGKATFYVRKDI
ncbi:MAG: Fic family protein [Treponema sp.]|nr:Fic family protein [Treponema sp.]